MTFDAMTTTASKNQRGGTTAMKHLYDRILITGGGGMLARALAEQLRARSFTPSVRDRAALDISDPARVRAVFEERKPTLVLNCAAYTKVDAAEDEPARADAINGYAVGELVNQCALAGAKLVHFSTDFVFDGTSRKPYRVTDQPNPISAYGRSKLLGEEQVLANPSCDALVVRTAWVYGRGGVNFPRVIVEKARQGQPLKVVNDEVGSPTYTADLATATFALLDAGSTGLWNVTNAGQVSRYEYARAILEIFGLKTELAPITTAEWFQIRPKQAHRPAYSVLDLEPLTRQLGRPMRDWRDALADFKRATDAAGGF
jgi:dTDP-4-dehydrorhamnose reductase